MNESVYGELPQFVIILVRFCHPISEIYNNQKRLIICKNLYLLVQCVPIPTCRKGLKF